MSRQRVGLAVLVAMAVAALVIAGALNAVQAAQEKEVNSVKLNVGDMAPDIELPMTDPATGNIKTGKLSDFRGKMNVVLAFYPKAFTPECTKQMCGYRDGIQAFQKADTQIVAVSLDDPAKSTAFQRKHSLPFPVVADPDRTIVKAYNVPTVNLWVVRFAKRSVFLIDKEGILRYINPHYNVKRDAAILLEQVGKLNANAPVTK